MPNFIDCYLTITGPNRQSVLVKLSGEPYEGHPVYFVVENIIPRPSDLGDNWQDWGYDNWGCRNVYPDRQTHVPKENADLLYFNCPNDPPLLAIRKLSEMFPANSFLLENHDEGGGPWAATLFRAGHASLHYVMPDYNSLAGAQATPFEIFRSVYCRSGLAAAEAEVTRVVGCRVLYGPYNTCLVVPKEHYDPTLDAEVEAHLRPMAYDVAMIPQDKAEITNFLALPDVEKEMSGWVMPSEAEQSESVMNALRELGEEL
jgi:hypothetical protein